jgi:hypothetical protein
MWVRCLQVGGVLLLLNEVRGIVMVYLFLEACGWDLQRCANDILHLTQGW